MIIPQSILGLFTNEELIKELIILLAGCTITAIPWTITYFRRKYNENRIPNVIRYNNDNFARETIKYRMKSIVMNVKSKYGHISDYSGFTDSIFGTDFLSSSIFSRYNSSLLASWSDSLSQYKGQKTADFLINAPFIDAEHYFYYYILHQVNIRKEGDKSDIVDPYLDNKVSSMTNDYLNDSEEHRSKIKELLDLALKISQSTGDTSHQMNLKELLRLNLSANSTDLSQLFWEQFSSVTPVIDDTEKFWTEYVSDLHNVYRVNVLVDNFGIEFLADIILGYYLILKKGREADIEIVYHVNQLPIFVSDVKTGDEILLFDTLRSLATDNPQYRGIIDELCSYMKKGKLVFRPNFFWNLPHAYSVATREDLKKSGEITTVRDIINSSDLLIVKGDLNYRRMIGDRNYNPSKSIGNKIRYIKCPLLVIRSFKSNVTLLGKRSNEFLKNNNIEQDWQSNGKYGIIQYIDR